MNPRAQIRFLPDGRRLHMHDGPIDLIVEAFGPLSEVKHAYQAASARFVTVLDELCAELSFLRQPARKDTVLPHGAVARRMTLAVRPHAARNLITPIAAIAGSVAEEILDAMTASATLTRAYVNDGGDIALYLAPSEQFIIGMVERPDRPSLFGTTTIAFKDSIRGIATSGWRGRSFSLGVADAVTVLADTASMADAAATMVANAVNLPDSPKITRRRARDLAPDTDLGEHFVTQAVAPLSLDEINLALEGGIREAELLRDAGLIRSAALSLQGQISVMPSARGSGPALLQSWNPTSSVSLRLLCGDRF